MFLPKFLISLACALQLTPQTANAANFSPLVFHVTLGSSEAIVLATMHASRIPATALSALADQVLTGANVLAIESLNNESAERELDALFAGNANDDASSFSALTKQSQSCVEHILNVKLSLAPELIAKLKKQHLSRIAAISWGALVPAFGFALFPGFDRVLLEHAVARKMEIVELEGAAAAYKYDRALPLSTIKADIQQVCLAINDSAQMAEYEREQRELFVLFELGKLDSARRRLFELNLHRMNFSRGDLAFSDNRNVLIASNLLLSLKKYKKSVIAIGPMHFTGPSAIQIQLESKGATVRRIDLRNAYFRPRAPDGVMPTSGSQQSKGTATE